MSCTAARCMAWACTTSCSSPDTAREQGPGKSRQSIVFRVIFHSSKVTVPTVAFASPHAPSQEAGIVRTRWPPTVPGVGNRGPLHAQHEIVRLCHAGLDSTTLRRSVMDEMRHVVPADAWCFPTADPATLMITGNVGEGLPAEAAPRFFEIEYSLEDFNKFAELARRPSPFGTLREATGGDMSRSPRWREVFHPLGLDDDLRAALVADGACWGYLALHRASGSFTAEDVLFVSRVVGHLAEGLRVSLIVEAAETEESIDGPGLILLNDAFEIASSSMSGKHWLAELGAHDQPDIGVLPASVYAVAARLRALEQSPSAGPELMPRARVRTSSGRWMIVHATRLSDA